MTIVTSAVSRRTILRGSAALVGALAMPAILRPGADAAHAQGVLAGGKTLPSPDFSLQRSYIAGARPHRTGGFRLETEELPAASGKKYVVHNYGHSGAGITLSWGCASIAADKVNDVLARLADAQPTVAVIGSGVIGLTSAIEILERWPNLKLTVYARDFKLEDTTSYKAGGQFEPSIIYNEYAGRMKVLHDTLRLARDKIAKLYAGGNNPYGISKRLNFTLREGSDGFDKGTPFDVVARPKIGPLPFAKLNEVGREYDTWLMDPTILLPKLIADLKQRGVAFVARAFKRGDLESLSETIILNCTGFGGAALSGDRAPMRPMRGQLIVLPNTQKLDYFFSGGCGGRVAYLFARQNDIVIGGSVEPGKQPDAPGECNPTSHDTAICDGFLRTVRSVFDGATAICHTRS